MRWYALVHRDTDVAQECGSPRAQAKEYPHVPGRFFVLS